ncbi:MAG: hypothetical protein CL674_09125 [Bdellovibrionaceae bacterium]|nr:hypothetical protein [Pseudobdellovibrionaceae bacterium]|tara:strand:- start:38747 stop:43930 length:5184 start_codon:yes stop_codon:yes gene_type:complete
MNLEKMNPNEKLVHCVQKTTHRLSVFELSTGGYRVLKTYFLDAFGVKAKALLGTPPVQKSDSENFYLNGLQITDQSLTHEFLVSKLELSEEAVKNHSLESIDLIQSLYKKSLSDYMLEEADLCFFECETFYNKKTESIEHLPGPKFRLRDFRDLSDILNELPADILFSLLPFWAFEVKKSYIDCQSHAINKAFFHFLKINFFPKDMELFYSPDEKDWRRDHSKNIEIILSHLPSEYLELAKRCFSLDESLNYASFSSFKFDFLVATQRVDFKNQGQQVNAIKRIDLMTKRHRSIVEKISQDIIQPVNRRSGECYLLQGSEQSLNSDIIKEVLESLPEHLVSVLNLREESRNLGVDFNPLYELLNQLLDLVCQQLTSSKALKSEFYNAFHSELNYLAAFNKGLHDLYHNVQISDDFIGIGRVNDWELKKIINKLVHFHLGADKRLLVVIDSKFRIGLNRSKTNSLDFLKLIEDLPVSIIGDYNSGVVENYFNYRLSEFGKSIVQEFEVNFLEEMEIEDYLLVTGLNDHRTTERLSRKLFNLSKGSKENLDSILSQAISSRIIQLNAKNEVEWNLEKLESYDFFLPNNYEHQEVFKDLSPGEKVILKRCALVEGGIQTDFLIHGVEQTGLSGINKLVERGFISRSFDGKSRASFSVSNGNLRRAILSNMEKRERTFLSIQLARIMSDLDITISPFLEGSLWAKVADYLAANNDKKKAVVSFLNCAREFLRISDYQTALSYLDLASTFLCEENKKYYEAVWGDFCLLMAVASFRNKKERAAEEYFQMALEHSTDKIQSAKIRLEWINLCVLVGNHDKAIELSEQNFKTLDFQAFGFSNYLWCFRLMFLTWFNFHNIKQCLRENNKTASETERLGALIETVIASAASYFSKDRLKFHLLQGIMTFLSNKLHGTKYAGLSLLNAGVMSGLLFNKPRSSENYFKKARMISEKLGAGFALSRIQSVETMMISSIKLKTRDLIEKLRSVANASLSNRDESFFIFAEHSAYLIEMMSGERAFSSLFRKIESSEYHCLKSNRREAYNSLNALKKNIYRFTEREDHIFFQGFDENIDSLSLNQDLESFSNLLGLGMTHFFDEDYKKAEAAFELANSGVFKNYSLPVRGHISYFLILSRLRILRKARFTKKLLKLPRLLVAVSKFSSLTSNGSETWLSKRKVVKHELQCLYMPKYGLRNYQLCFYQFSGSWSLLDRTIGSSMLSKMYLEASNAEMSAKLLDQLLLSAEDLEFERLSHRVISSYSEGSIPANKAELSNQSMLSDPWKKTIDLLIGLQNSSARDSVERLVQYSFEYTKAEKLLLVLNDKNQNLELKLFCKNTKLIVGDESLKEIKLSDISAYENLVYTLETGRINRIENAMNDSSLLDRDYIEQNEVKSVYVMPIFFEKKEIGVLYLENNSTENAFTGLSNEIPSLLSTMILSALKKDEDKRKLNEKVLKVESELSLAREKISSFTQRVESANTANETLHNIVGILQSLSFEIEKFEIEFLKENALAKDFLSEINNYLDGLGEKEIATELESIGLKLNKSFSRNAESVDSLTSNFIDKLQLLKQSIHSQQSVAKAIITDKDFSLSEALDLAEEIMKPKFEQTKISYQLKTQPEIYLKSTKALWVQAFVNLLKNSVEAILELQPEKPEIKIDVFFKDNNLVLQFKDNGIGISKEDQGKLAQYGFSTRKDGHGFGLHSVYNLITGLDGDLVFHSEGLGKGCEVEIKIPLKNLK